MAKRTGLGVRLSLRIPFDRIEGVAGSRLPHPARDTPGYLRAALMGDPQILVRLKTPLRAEGLYGKERTITLVGLRVDDPGVLIAELRRRIS